MNKFIVYYIIVTFSIVIIPLTYNTIYYIPQYVILFLAPFLLFPEGLNRKDTPLVYFGFALLSTGIWHPESFRISTVAYSILNISLLILYSKILPKSKIAICDFQRLIRCIIFSFAIVLLIQDICRFVGLEPINASYNLDRGFEYKLNSLAFETSQTGRVVTVLMYVYILIEEIQIGRHLNFSELFKGHKKTFLAYSYVSIFSFSVTCMMTFFILLIYFVPRRHLLKGVLGLFVIIVVFFSLGTEIGNRILELGPLIMTMDANMIYQGDPSSSARIGPIIIYLKEFDLTSLNTWLGYGCDYGKIHTWHELINDDTHENYMAVGGMINYLYDYGLIAIIPFFWYLHTLFKFKSFSFFLYMTAFFLSGFNFYIAILFMLLMYSVKYYGNISKNLYYNRNL